MTGSVVGRLASAVARFETHRDRLRDLHTVADQLAEIDVVVVDGELAVLAALDETAGTARGALTDLVAAPADMAVLKRFEDAVGSGVWSMLDSLDQLLDTKRSLADRARHEVRNRLATWSDVATRMDGTAREIQTRHLDVVEPRRLSLSRNRTGALLRQANNALARNQLLDAWRALTELDRDDPTLVPAREVPERLAHLVANVGTTSGRLQLTALRGPQDGNRFEYTFMLLTPTADRHIGVNVQDSSTIVDSDRRFFLDAANAAGQEGYRALRALRDGRPPAEVVRPDTDQDTLRRLRTMGLALYRLLIPDPMKDELDRHPATPLTIITNDLEIPWELMFTDRFLALHRPITRMPVGRARVRRAPPVDVHDRRRRVALIASAGPENELAGAVREVRTIAERLRAEWADDVIVDTFGTGPDNRPTGAEFRTVLMSGRYDIIHYAGHASFDRVNSDRSGLLLADGEICFAQKIQRLLEGNPLVFLNACESARLRGPGDVPGTGGYVDDPDDGLASAFVYGGALACIGTMWPVLDTEAAEFAIAFYKAALEGYLLGEAMRRARVEAHRTFADKPGWASFVLYGDPTYSIGTSGRTESTAILT